MKRVPLLDRSRPASLAPRVPTSWRVPDGISRQQYDSLENLLTGLGGSADKMTGTKFTFNEMDKVSLENAFRSDWIARKCVVIPAQDATREWRSWMADTKDIGVLEDLEKELKIQMKVKLALTKARLYGGSALLLGVVGGTMATELVPEKVGKDALKFVHVVSRWELSAGELDWDLDSPYYGTPKYYMRSGVGSSGDRIHPSRVIRFVGNEVPDIQLTLGWGDSILQVVSDAVLAAGITCASGAQLVSELKMDVVKVPELTESLSNKAYESRLTKRFGLANQTKSLYNIMLLDKEEEWERITANLTGLPDTLKLYLLVASGAVDIPATRFLGQSPAGLSATGESDIRNWYDHVRSEQVTIVQPALSPLDEIMIRSALGTKKPEDVTSRWNPLWQMDEKDKAEVATKKSTVFKADVDTGLIPSEILRDARINQLIEDGTYPNLEQLLDEYGELDPIDDNPEPGAVIGPDGQPISPTDPKHPANQGVHLGPDGKPIAGPDGKPIPKIPAAKGKKPPFGKDMASRVRNADVKSRRYRAMDGVMRTLYVYRPVLNARAILAWAKSEGIPHPLVGSELHVTVCYSKTPVDWAKTGDPYDQNEDGEVHIRPGGMRVVQKFGNAVVLCFNSSSLQWRHQDLKRVAGATYDYEEYQPHVTISYIQTDDEPFDVEAITAWQGEIVLGPEVYAEATGNPMVADECGNPFFDFNENHEPAGTPEGGQFAEGEGGAGSGVSVAGAGAAGDRVKGAVGDLPEKFVKASGVTAMTAYKNDKAMAKDFPSATSKTIGVYNNATKKLGLNMGHSKMSDPIELRRTIAHEMAHAYDNKKKLAVSAEFKTAFKKDELRAWRSDDPMKPGLRYYMSKPGEAFAEGSARLLTKTVDKDYAATFPSTLAVLKKHYKSGGLLA